MFSSWFKEKQDPLELAESRMLSVVRTPYRKEHVQIEPDIFINTIHVDGAYHPNAPEKPVLVLVHGFGSGLGWWCKNYDELSKHYQVKALDIMGFAGSSRPSYRGRTAQDAIDWFIDSIEKWRAVLGLKAFFLMGHSMGGYIVACYALRYPQYIQHLILADPVGISKPPEEWGQGLGFVWKLALDAAWTFGPLFPLRMTGQWGLRKLRERRSDLVEKFPFEDSNIIFDYLFQCNSRYPSGEHAFISMFLPGAWAAHPLQDDLTEVRVSHLTFLYGDRSWVTSRSVPPILNFKHAKVSLHMIPHGTHHFYADSVHSFHQHMIGCKLETETATPTAQDFKLSQDDMEAPLGGDILNTTDVAPDWADSNSFDSGAAFE